MPLIITGKGSYLYFKKLYEKNKETAVKKGLNFQVFLERMHPALLTNIKNIPNLRWVG